MLTCLSLSLIDAGLFSSRASSVLGTGSAAAHDNWRRLANLNDVVYDVDNNYNLNYAGTKGSFTSGALSLVSFVGSWANLPPATIPPPSPPPPSPGLPPLAPIAAGQTWIAGCMDPTAANYNPTATVSIPRGEQGECRYEIRGCMLPDAFNYIPTANVDDGSCVFKVEGCTSQYAGNYGERSMALPTSSLVFLRFSALLALLHSRFPFPPSCGLRDEPGQPRVSSGPTPGAFSRTLHLAPCPCVCVRVCACGRACVPACVFVLLSRVGFILRLDGQL